jgi:hypothetical protein
MDGEAGAVNGGSIGMLDPSSFEGFGYLLGKPEPAQRSRLGQDLATARRVVGVLAAAMTRAADRPQWKASLAPGVALDDNPGIPSGYTYLLQFVAHDLVQTDIPFWAAADAGVASRNVRGRGLQLDTLHGGGPSACPVAFSPAGEEAIDRSLLRVGRVDPGNQKRAEGRCPYRDLARVHTPAFRHIAANGEDAVVNFDGAFQVLAADARNDASTILAQLTALFANLHNIIARAQPAAGPGVVYLHTRSAMLQIYYSVIRHDLLSRVLHPAIRKHYEGAHEALWAGTGMPLEFTHGAMRAGHAMVQPLYDLNDTVGRGKTIAGVLTANRGAGDSRRPVTPEWIVQWSRFFALDSVPHFSRRIGARKSSLDSSLFVNLDAPADGTTYRDLLSAALARCWHVDALIEEIQRRAPGLIPSDWPFATRERRRERVGAWLRGIIGDRPDAADAIARLTDDPPLPLFVLLEAELDPQVQGASLGVLGSIIAAEVFYRRLHEGQKRVAAVLPRSEEVLGAMWPHLTAIKTMPDLVRFVAAQPDFAHCHGIPLI